MEEKLVNKALTLSSVIAYKKATNEKNIKKPSYYEYTLNELMTLLEKEMCELRQEINKYNLDKTILEKELEYKILDLNNKSETDIKSLMHSINRDNSIKDKLLNLLNEDRERIVDELSDVFNFAAFMIAAIKFNQ